MSEIKIGIIGMGWVGSSVAISILQKGICQHLLLNDLNKDIAEGEAMDLNHGSSFYPSAEVKSVEISEMMDTEAIVITAGRGGEPGESRLDLLRENIEVARKISRELVGYKGILIIVSNPVDVLTYFYQKFTEIPAEKVIGTGTLLDTARLRDEIGARFDIDSKSVHANVVGEHGDSEVVLWTKANIGGLHLQSWKEWKPAMEEEIAEKVRIAAQEIIKRKGATNHAIGLVTASLLEWILRGERRVVTVSRVVNGPYGFRDLAISGLVLISREGASEFLEVKMAENELRDFHKSALIIKEVIKRAK